MKRISILLLVLVFVAGCTMATPSQQMSGDSLLKFSSQSELTDFISGISSGSSYLYGGLARSAVPMMAVSEMAFDSQVSVAGSSTKDYSQTNVQVAGIDEIDMLKTDGEYIYTISGNTLFIVSATPASDATIISQIKFDATPTGLFVEDDKLFVVGNTYQYSFRSYGQASSFALMYDIAERESPQLIENITFEGYIQHGRLFENTAYIVVVSQPTIDHPWPIFYRNGAEKAIAIDDIYYFPRPYDSASYVTVHAFGLENGDLKSSSVLTDGAQTVYMSSNALYLTTTNYVNEWQIREDIFEETLAPYLTQEDKTLIAKIEATDSDVLSKYEKESKINSVYYERLYKLDSSTQKNIDEKIESELEYKLSTYQYFETTHITKLDLETLAPIATAEVPGSVYSQFALGEHDDVLRVATTINQRWTKNTVTQSQSHVYTLDSDLAVLGSVTGLGLNESIYSVRYVGDRAYIVTFRQIDPFYVIDLSDPQNPTTLGELKIPGFSRYLHPINETHVLGLGQDANDRGRVTGLKIAVYDVTNPSRPQEIAIYSGTSENEYSSALNEHKAFFFDASRGLLVIPVQNYDYEKNANYAGAYVFTVGADAITRKGFIDHTVSPWSPGVERSFYIGANLYTKSYSLIRINDFDTLESVKDVKLPTTQIDDVFIY